MLNSSFVPVHVDGTWVRANPERAGDELKAYRDLMSEFHRVNGERKQAGKKPLSIGTVHAYVLGPDGKAIDSRHVAHAGPASVFKMLSDAVAQVKPAAGKPLVAPSAPLCITS